MGRKQYSEQFKQDAVKSVTAVYDAWNRLVRLKDAESDRIAEYEYDGRGFRIIKRTFDGSSSENLTGQRHSYYNSQWQLLEERVTDTLTSWDPDAADPERIYMWGKRYIDDLILRKRSSSNNGTFDEKLYAIQDANFNVIGLFDPPVSDGGGGTGLVQRFEYDAYGNCLELKADLSASPVEQADTRDWNIRFAGYRYDSETAMYYVRNRNYHPLLGKWVQRDPIGYVDGMNDYEYVQSNSLKLLDPEGLDSSRILEMLGIVRLVKFFDRSPAGMGCCPSPSETLRGILCCDNVKYNRHFACCEEGRVVSKEPIWICERHFLDPSGGPYLPLGSVVLPRKLHPTHSYVCCDGINLNCYGKQSKTEYVIRRFDGLPIAMMERDALAGDLIPREPVATGKCIRIAVCPSVKRLKCESPVCDFDYSLTKKNCHDWALRHVK